MENINDKVITVLCSLENPQNEQPIEDLKKLIKLLQSKECTLVDNVINSIFGTMETYEENKGIQSLTTQALLLMIVHAPMVSISQQRRKQIVDKLLRLMTVHDVELVEHEYSEQEQIDHDIFLRSACNILCSLSVPEDLVSSLSTKPESFSKNIIMI